MFRPSAPHTLASPLIVAMLIASLAGCSSAGNAAAQSAYDGCIKEGAEVQLLQLDGASVSVEVTGENAQALSNMESEMNSVLNGSGTEPDGPGGLAVALSMLGAVDCLVEATDYPGGSDDLENGDEWDGWRYSEESGAGSETTMRFTATG